MQLLEEAKSTELFNMATLERMKKLEAIKKKPVPVRYLQYLKSRPQT